MRHRSLLALSCAAALTLVACGGDDDDDATETTTAESAPATDAPATTSADTEPTTEPTTADTTAATEPTESTDATETTATEATTGATEATTAGSAPAGAPDATPTAPGTELAFGQPAVVAFDEEAPDQLVQLVVQPVTQGTPEELAELQVEDAVEGSTLHYVTLEITNVSMPETGADYSPNLSFQLGVLQSDGDVATPVVNFVSFEPCDEEDPDELAVGASYTTCQTYLAAPGTTVDGVYFASDLSSEPITWR